MNLNKYKYYRFDKDDSVNKQLKALLLKFDFEVDRCKLDKDGQISLINDWIDKFENSESYEYLNVFKQRKALINNMVVEFMGISVDELEFKAYQAPLLERIKIFFKSFLNKA